MTAFPLKRFTTSTILLALAAAVGGCEAHSARPARSEEMPQNTPPVSQTVPSASPTPTTAGEVATFGAGCFWCVEAVLEQLEGVKDVRSGYMGGSVANPSYEQVCSGSTGHAEVVQVTFDPAKISYDTLLDWFWQLHDPTTLNRQGNDVGTQYRSAIFFHSDAQRDAAEKARARLAASGKYRSPIVTEITAAGPFFEAEKYHQEYYRQNSAQPYCRFIIRPKLEKLGLEGK